MKDMLAAITELTYAMALDGMNGPVEISVSREDLIRIKQRLRGWRLPSPTWKNADTNLDMSRGPPTYERTDIDGQPVTINGAFPVTVRQREP